MIKYLLLILLLGCSLHAATTGFHISTGGSNANNGSRSKPFPHDFGGSGYCPQ